MKSAQDYLKTTQYQSTDWLPVFLRKAIRRITGGDEAAAQLLRGLLWRYRLFVVLAVVANIASAFFEGSTMAIFTLALDALASESDLIDTSALGTLGGLISGWQTRLGTRNLFFLLVGLAVVSQLLRSGLDFLGKVATAYLTAWLEGDLRRRIFRQLMRFSFPHISRYKTGDLISYTEQVNNMGYLIIGLNGLINHFTIAIAYGVVLLWLSWQISLAALLALLLLSSSLRGIIVRVRTIATRFVQANVSLNERVVEFLGGLRLIHTFHRQHYATSSVDSIINQAVYARRSGLIWANAITPIVQSLTVIGVALFLFVSYFFVIRNNLDAVPRIVTFVFVLYRLMPRVTAINSTLGSLSNQLPYASRIANILSDDDKEYSHVGKTSFTGFCNAITFNNVTLCYPESVQPAISDLSFTIRRGSMVAFVGASGAGKSTIVNLLLRLYDLTSGHITVDGSDLGDLRREDWLEAIGVVDQDTFVFHASIADNIRFGKLDASDEAVKRAAQIANADEFIMGLSEDYATVVGDRGYRLSGGQRQRIAIARAVLREPDILIFDEATSALDSHSERLIQESLEKLRQERTLIVIAHRLSTIVQADQIIVLGNGQVIEQGTHAELLAMGKHYASLSQLQGVG